MSSSTMTSPPRRRERRLLRSALALAFVAAAVASQLTIAQDVAPGKGSVPGERTIDIYGVDGELGTYLVDPEDMTLYYFAEDVYPGVSHCHGPCAEAWPPLTVKLGFDLVAEGEATGSLRTARRPDGTFQATYRGRPLYYFSKDEEAGDMRGHGLGGVWFVAMEDGSIPQDPEAAPADPPSVTLGSASGELGDYLTDPEGMTLYYFAADAAPGLSACDADCQEAWPPLTVQLPGHAVAAAGVPGLVGQMQGEDEVQITYDGRPLYAFAGDTAPGETNGHGVNDVWHVALTDGSLPFE